MTDPAVSIVMVAHNADAYMAQALESIQRQTFVGFELIIINDASTDRTGMILARQIDSRFVVHTNDSRVGLVESVGKADAMARGKYIARMDPNDLSHPHRIQAQAGYLEAHPDIDLVSCHSFRIDDKGAVVCRNPLTDTIDEIKNRLRHKGLFFDSSVMFRRSTINKADHMEGVDLDRPHRERYPTDSKKIKTACIGEALYYRRCTSVEKNSSESIKREDHIAADSGKTADNNNSCDMARYDQLHAKVMACPDDEGVLQAYYQASVQCDKLAHAKSTFKKMSDDQPGNHAVRRLLIGILLQLKELKPAMDTIEQLVACSTPDDTLVDMALHVRKQLGMPFLKDIALARPSISLCMIIKNEAALLGPCLNSIKGSVDEIIVVDTGSTDRSADVARIYGAHVFSRQWRNDFSDARNASIEKANGDWILILDADEVIDPRDQAAIVQVVRRDSGRTNAYAFKTRNYTNLMTVMDWQANDGGYAEYEAGTGWFPTTKVRLFPNDATIRFRYPVHELVDPSIESAGYEIIQFPGPIHHYGTVNEAKNRTKASRYFELGYVKLEQYGKDRAAIRELAVQAGQLERWPESIQLWERLLTLLPDYDEALVNMSGAYWQLGQYEKGVMYARRAVQTAPELKEAAYNLSINLMMVDQLEEASEILRKVLGLHPEYLAADFMLAAIHSLSHATQRGQARFRAIEKKISNQALTVAVNDLLLRLTGSILDGRKQQIIQAAGIKVDAKQS